MSVLRIVGFLVCVACVGIGLRVVDAGKREGYASIVSGVVLGALWIALMAAASR